MDGKPNIHGDQYEDVIDKVRRLEDLCPLVVDYVSHVNNELYDMRIPHHVLLGWHGLQAVRSICVKLALKYTEFVPSKYAIHRAEINSLKCIQQTEEAVGHIAFSAVSNPKKNITPSALDLMCRLFQRCTHAMSSYLELIITTHRNVQAE